VHPSGPAVSSPNRWNSGGFPQGDLRPGWTLACWLPSVMLCFAVGLRLQSGELLSDIHRIDVVGLDLEYTF